MKNVAFAGTFLSRIARDGVGMNACTSQLEDREAAGEAGGANL